MVFGLNEEDFRFEDGDLRLKEVRRRNRSEVMKDPSIQQKDILEALEAMKVREKKDRLAKNPAMGEALEDLYEPSPRAARRKKSEMGDPEAERLRKLENQRERYRKKKEKELEKKAKKSSESSPAARGPPKDDRFFI
jgi:hypothetical protein